MEGVLANHLASGWILCVMSTNLAFGVIIGFATPDQRILLALKFVCILYNESL